MLRPSGKTTLLRHDPVTVSTARKIVFLSQMEARYQQLEDLDRFGKEGIVRLRSFILGLPHLQWEAFF